jgi:DNA-binding NarL/FixJ family response regulator
VTIRIVVADDHPVVRDGLRAMLATEPDLEVVGEATTGAEAVALVDATRPDVVLMDLQMPDTDGATATAAIRHRHPHVHVLVLTTYDTDADITRAIDAGATGYLLKDSHRHDLFEAVRFAAQGQSVLSPAIATRVLDRLRTSGTAALTSREIEVLAAISRGLSNKDAARTLHVSEATIKTHLIHIFQKLGVDDRTAAVTVALERGILRPGRS